MKLLRSIRIFSVLLFAMGIAQVASADTLKLKLGNEGTYPPFAITATDGTLSGMEPDLARALCDRMNAECEIVTMDFGALLPSLVAGKLDMIVSQLTRKPERMKATQFTRDILENSAVFVVSKDWNKGFSTDDLNGVKVAVQKGSAHASWIEDNRPKPSRSITRTPTSRSSTSWPGGSIPCLAPNSIGWRPSLIHPKATVTNSYLNLARRVSGC